jgi:hypothetical protein
MPVSGVGDCAPHRSGESGSRSISAAYVAGVALDGTADPSSNVRPATACWRQGIGGTVTDYWSDVHGGCWADVWEEGFEDARACNAAPAPGSALGLCPEHEARSWRLRGARKIHYRLDRVPR